VAWPGGARQSVGEIPARVEVRVREDGAVEVHPVVPALSEEERVRRFWETYRAAGRARIEGRWEEALAGYRTSSLLDRGHADSWYYRGQLARELGLLDEAAEAFSTLIQVDPTSARAHRELGWLHLCTEDGAPRDPDAAQMHFQRAFEINQEHTQASLDLAVAELATGADGRAGERARQVLRTDPANPGARYLSAYLAWLEGGDEKARALLEAMASADGPGARGMEGAASAEGDTDGGAGPMTQARGACIGLASFWETGGGAGPSVEEVLVSLPDFHRAVQTTRSGAD
jgi:tetratricopeptide (TPR) repeat protein